MTQRGHSKNEPGKQSNREKERREFIRGILFDILWFGLDLWFVWPISHVWAVVLGAVVIAIHLLTSSWTLKNRLIYLVVLVLCTASTIDIIPPNETELHGYLTPANDPILSGPCPAPSDKTANLYFGGNEAILRIGMTLVVLAKPHHPLVCFQLTDKGLMVTGEIYSHSGEVAWLINNEFWLNQNLQFRSVHPDPHTLIVRDNMGIENLSIRYLNKRSIRFTGCLFLPGEDRSIVIDHDFLTTTASDHPTGKLFGTCIDSTDTQELRANLF